MHLKPQTEEDCLVLNFIKYLKKSFLQKHFLFKIEG